MNEIINKKLEALRESLLAEASSSDAYSQRLVDADQEFLKQVAKKLKSTLGGKLAKVAVKRGIGIAWLEGEGEDRSDLSLDFTLSLHLLSPSDVKLELGGTHVAKGKLDRSVAFKTGELTPLAAAEIVLGLFQS